MLHQVLRTGQPMGQIESPGPVVAILEEKTTCVYLHPKGFPIHFSARGGMRRDSITTIGLNSIVYFIVI